MAEALTVCGTLLAAVLAYVLGARQDGRSRLHDERIAATADFCRALMDYRGAQIHRWHSENSEAETLADARAAVRDTRSAVWACYFRVVLVLEEARALRLEPDADSLDAAGHEVRRLAEVFVGHVARKLGIEPVSLAGDAAPASSRHDASADPGWLE